MLLAAAAALTALAIGPTAHAQQQPNAAAAAAAASQKRTTAVDRSNDHPNTLSLTDRAAADKTTVTADDLYRGFRATRLLGQEVKGPNGNKIGEVQDIFVDHEGKITAIVVKPVASSTLGTPRFG